MVQAVEDDHDAHIDSVAMETEAPKVKVVKATGKTMTLVRAQRQKRRRGGRTPTTCVVGAGITSTLVQLKQKWTTSIKTGG